MTTLRVRTECPEHVNSRQCKKKAVIFALGRKNTALEIKPYMGLRIAGDNLVRWRFDNVEINYLSLFLILAF